MILLLKLILIFFASTLAVYHLQDAKLKWLPAFCTALIILLVCTFSGPTYIRDAAEIGFALAAAFLAFRFIAQREFALAFIAIYPLLIALASLFFYDYRQVVHWLALLPILLFVYKIGDDLNESEATAPLVLMTCFSFLFLIWG